MPPLEALVIADLYDVTWGGLVDHMWNMLVSRWHMECMMHLLLLELVVEQMRWQLHSPTVLLAVNIRGLTGCLKVVEEHSNSIRCSDC